MTVEPLKILLYDLETAPMLAYIWRPDDQYVPMDRLIHDTFLLTWSAKWYGERQVHQGIIHPDEVFEHDDSRIVVELANLIAQADILVAHNGDRFDVPMLNNRLLALDLEPMGPKRTIDTLKLAKKNFRLAYNKLDYLGELLGLGRKLKTDFELWRQCLEGNTKAINRMARYNRQDVILLEQIFDKLLPYSNGVARMVEGTDTGEMACPSCGCADVELRGFHRTNISTFQKFRCKKCLRYSRSRVAEKNRLGLAPL